MNARQIDEQLTTPSAGYRQVGQQNVSSTMNALKRNTKLRGITPWGFNAVYEENGWVD